VRALRKSPAPHPQASSILPPGTATTAVRRNYNYQESQKFACHNSFIDSLLQLEFAGLHATFARTYLVVNIKFKGDKMINRAMKVTTVGEEFYRPILRALENAAWKRECPEYTDEHFLKVGVGRCLNDVRSGRDWIQKAMMILRLTVTVSRFFISLKSPRRLRLLGNVADTVRSETDKTAPSSDDPFAQHVELDGFAIYAADGHFHGTSAHEEAIAGKRRAVGHFFGMNLRTQSMIHLDVARPKVKREHDITALKRLQANALRMGEPKGRKVILAYDSAIYDFNQWNKWKQSKGIYVITRMKENTSLLICGDREFERDDPRNTGIVSDQFGGTNSGDMLRKIVYVEPATGKKYVFLTNEMTLPPGLIAFIYKKR
jgi:hypothetical protein